MAKSTNKNNTYYKSTGKKVTIPSRYVSSKQTAKSENTLGKAQDTGRGKGPLRGVARRARNGMEFLSDDAMKKKYPSQVVRPGTTKKTQERVSGKITNGKVTPPKNIPVKSRSGGLRGGMSFGSGSGLRGNVNK